MPTRKARRTPPRPGSHIACTWTNTCRLLSYLVSQRVSLTSFWPLCPLVVLLRPRFPCSNSQNRPRPHHPPRGACASHQIVFTLGIKVILVFTPFPPTPSLFTLVFRSFFDSWSQGAASSLIFLFPTPRGPRWQESTHTLVCLELFWPIFSPSLGSFTCNLTFPSRPAQKHRVCQSCEALLFLGHILSIPHPSEADFWKQSL